MCTSASFSLTEFGAAWPSGNFREIAEIDVSYEDVRNLVSCDLLEGFEEGMGVWTAIGIKLDGGEVIELIRYGSNSNRPFTLRVDIGVSFSDALEKILILLGKSRDSLKWVSPLLDDGRKP